MPCDGNHQKALEIPVLNSHKEEDTSTHLSSSNWERGPEKSEVTVEYPWTKSSIVPIVSLCSLKDSGLGDGKQGKSLETEEASTLSDQSYLPLEPTGTCRTPQSVALAGVSAIPPSLGAFVEAWTLERGGCVSLQGLAPKC